MLGKFTRSLALSILMIASSTANGMAGQREDLHQACQNQVNLRLGSCSCVARLALATLSDDGLALLLGLRPEGFDGPRTPPSPMQMKEIRDFIDLISVESTQGVCP